MKNNPIKSNFRPLRCQNGGTFIGIIIGLVIGLSIAVVVAIMITKTSTPFTNKLGLTKSDAPAVQLTDPNKPLYGSSAKELIANANKPDATGTQANAPVVPAQPVQTEQVRPADPIKPEVKADQKGDAKSAKPVDPVVAKSDGDTSIYYLQVGAFRDAGDAESAKAKLALIGVDSQVSNSDGDNLYRVRIGPYTQLDNVTRMRNKLSENNIDVAVIKTPK